MKTLVVIALLCAACGEIQDQDASIGEPLPGRTVSQPDQQYRLTPASGDAAAPIEIPSESNPVILFRGDGGNHE